MYARPLDFAWWKCIIEEESNQLFTQVMSVYQNEDGGIGHGIEPASFNAFSSPYQTNWWSPDVLMELGIGKERNIVKGILKYLDSGAYLTEEGWPWSIPTDNDYPHEPWMEYHGGNFSGYDLSVTSRLLGFIFLYAEKESDLFKKGVAITNNLLSKFEDYTNEYFKQGGYELGPFMELSFAIGGYETLSYYIEKANLKDHFDYNKIKERLIDKPVVNDEEKELDELIDIMQSDKYLELGDLTYCEKDKYWKEVSISLYWWIADKIIKDMHRLKKAQRLE